MRKLIALLMVGAALQIVTGATAAGNDVAKGHGTTFFGDTFAFSATSAFNGNAPRGSARLDTAIGAQAVTLSGDVTCLRVAGNLASIGVEITNISPPNAFLSFVRSAIIQTSDSGKFGSTPDTVVYFFSSAPAPTEAACPVPSAGSPISTGDVVIQDATS